MDKEEAYAKFIADLEAAWKKTRRDHWHGQIMAAEATVDFLLATDAPRIALQPLIWTIITLTESDWTQRHSGKSGPRQKRFTELSALSGAAAAVSVVKKKHSSSVGDALTKVARLTQIPKEEIRKYRDALHRGTTDEVFSLGYKRDLETFARMSDAEFNHCLRRLRTVYKEMNYGMDL